MFQKNIVTYIPDDYLNPAIDDLQRTLSDAYTVIQSPQLLNFLKQVDCGIIKKDIISAIYLSATNGDLFELISFAVLVNLTFLFYLTASLMDPGYVPIQSEEVGNTFVLPSLEVCLLLKICTLQLVLESIEE